MIKPRMQEILSIMHTYLGITTSSSVSSGKMAVWYHDSMLSSVQSSQNFDIFTCMITDYFKWSTKKYTFGKYFTFKIK